jgi:hypothetical protein
MERTPLVMLPDGSLYRTSDVPPDGIIVQEPPLVEVPAQSVVDQTAAATGSAEPDAPPKALYDI